MSTYKTEGIIIKRANFLESSLILDIYTKDFGKIEAVARSARKAKGKLKGHLELFLDTDLILACGKNIDIITNSFTNINCLDLRNNLEFSFGAYYISELVDKMTIAGHRDEQVFYLLKKTLLFFNELASSELKENVRLEYCLAILFFQISILNINGFSPELNKCVFCSKLIKSSGNYFSFFMGGIVGNECFSKDIKKVSINDNLVKLLRIFKFKGGKIEEFKKYLKKYFSIMQKIKVDEDLVLTSIFLMNNFIEFNIDRKIKSVDFLRGI